MPERIFKPAIVQETDFEVRDVVMQTSRSLCLSPPLEAEPSSCARDLASRQGLRDAIILREIFGPPRSLQPPDLVSSCNRRERRKSQIPEQNPK